MELPSPSDRFIKKGHQFVLRLLGPARQGAPGQLCPVPELVKEKI
jgi:hypothetical protein